MDNFARLSNKLIDIEDMKRPEWLTVLEEMHGLMKVPKRKQGTLKNCTDRKGLLYHSEIQTYKHWEYPWAIQWGLFEPGLSVLDCGCGRGFLQIYLATKGCKVTSVDISTLKTKVIRNLWNWVNKLKFPIHEDKTSAMKSLARNYHTSLDFHVANIDRLPFENESFDRVYSISVLEHMNQGEDEEAIKEMSRVLKPGGRLLITVDFSQKPLPYTSYTETDIHRLIRISNLKLLGDYNYKVDHWDKYLDGLRTYFDKQEANWSAAGFVLIKEK